MEEMVLDQVDKEKQALSRSIIALKVSWSSVTQIRNSSRKHFQWCNMTGQLRAPDLYQLAEKNRAAKLHIFNNVYSFHLIYA